ncbi:MAG: tripartite tricarboxylate transporter TctB family protein [Proteobacteria bacterium]|nr:tripartite tricarboxylate transporter TctB family protein [Pseudomonadota bacterium]
MSQGAEPAAGPPHGFAISSPRDFYGGLALVGLSLFAFWASHDLPGMRGFAFGPGTAPRMFATLLGVTGVVITFLGVTTKGEPLERFALRGPLFVTASIFAFAATIRPVGLVIASFVTFMVSAAASKETRWLESTITAVVLTAFCVALFVYLLNLPFQLWPHF